MKIIKILELSQRATKAGQKKIKIALATMGETNRNGLHWIEEHVVEAMKTFDNIPISADLDALGIPLGHGYTRTEKIDVLSEYEEPYFENSVIVGIINRLEIEDVTIDNETKRMLVGYGYIYYSHYPDFAIWLKKSMLLGNIDTSIEIVGTEENNRNIVYVNNDTSPDFRIPQIFEITGTAILSIPPADKNAIVLEVASKNMEENMDEKQMQELKDFIKMCVADAMLTNDEYSQKIEKMAEESAMKDSELAAMIEKCATLEAEACGVKKENSELEEKVKEINSELDKAKAEAKLAELNEAIKDFTEDEVSVAKESIESFKNDPINNEINSIVTKIKTAIADKTLESRKTEINNYDCYQPVYLDREVESKGLEKIDIYS